MSKSNKKNFSSSPHSIFFPSWRNVNQRFECFVTTLLKWMSYKNRLVFTYFNILRFYCFKKSLQSVLKTWQVLKSKNKIFWKMSKYRNTVFYDFKSRFLVIFVSNYRHRPVLKISFPDHIFPKISKYCTENLYFPSTGKHHAPLPPVPSF